MDIKSRKLNFIQEILALSNEKIIDKLELLLKNEKKKYAKNTSSYSVYDLLGAMTEKEAIEMKKEIEKSCEIIHEEDWK